MSRISKKWTTVIIVLVAVSYIIFFYLDKFTNSTMLLISFAIALMVSINSFHFACRYGIVYKGERRKDDTVVEGIMLSSWGVGAMATVGLIVWIAFKFKWI